MIRVQFDTASTARVRFASSPAYETAAWLGVTAAGFRHPVHGDPGPAARFALRDRDVAVVAVLARGSAAGAYMPDFLTPVPGRGAHVFADQLDQVRETGAGWVHAEVDFLSTTTRPLPREIRDLTDTGRLRRVAAAGLAKFNRVVLADASARIAAGVTADIHHRGSLLACGGVGELLDGLDPVMRWTGSGVEIDKPYEEDLQLRDTDVVLVPSVLALPRLATQLHGPAGAMLAYPATGTHDLPTAATAATATGAGDALLGRGRLAVLRALDRARSTTEVSAVVGLSTATVSHHLHVLTDAGLLTRTRQGRSVHYQHTPAARTLLTATRPGPGVELRQPRSLTQTT